jgi:peptide/nickel transport system permease protein
MALAEPYLAPSAVRRNVLGRRRTRHATKLGFIDRVSIGVLGGITLLAVVVPWVAPHSATKPIGAAFTHPFSGHLLGTDEVGRDVLSRVLFGMSTSWLAALLVITSGVIVGGIIGLVAGFAGGWIDTVFMRTTDAFLALPGPILAMAVVAALGPSLQHTLVAVMIVWWLTPASCGPRSDAGRSTIEGASPEPGDGASPSRHLLRGPFRRRS